MRIFIYGNDGRLAVCRRLLLSAEARGEIPPGVRDIHLLPIPSYRFGLSDFKGELCVGEGVYQTKEQDDSSCKGEGECRDPKGESEVLEGESRDSKKASLGREGDSAHLDEKKAQSYDLIVGYGVQPSFYEFEGVRVLDLEGDEAFLRRNARLTALGTVGILLCEGPRALPELNVGIVGYGRIGRELVDILSFFECRLVVFSANEESMAELLERGICTAAISWHDEKRKNVNYHLQKSGFLQNLDILLNTSPSKFDEVFFDGYEGKIYDLASGEPIPPSVKYTRLPSLPMRMYSASAGHAVYESVMRALYETDRERI